MIKNRLHFTLVSISITALIISSGSTFSSEPNNIEISESPTTFGFEYFPLKINKTMIYKSNFGETKSHVEMKDGEIIVINESDDFKYVQNFLLKDDGIYITKTEQHLEVFLFISSEAKIKYNEPALRIPMPLSNLSTWRWEGVEYKDNDSSNIIIEGRYKGIEEIITPAGSFNCVNIELNVESEHGSKSVVNEWLAPNVGLVKLHAEIEGAGLLGVLQDILGYDEIYFELQEII